MWCPKSCRVVVNGEMVGLATTENGVKKALKLRKVKQWVMKQVAYG